MSAASASIGRSGIFRLAALVVLAATAQPVVAAPTRPAMPATSLPTPAGWVTDAAGVLRGPAKSQLTQQLTAFEARTKHQLAVVTIASLQGGTIEAVSLALFNRWGIGRKDINDGVLLLIAPNDQRLRIAVVSGLEATLDDATCARIIRESIVPRFASGDLEGGISQGTAAIIAVLDAADGRAGR